MLFRYITVSVFILLVISACSPKHSEIIVAEYADEDITMAEFEKAYAKNVGGYEAAADDSISEYKRFAELYLNFKMKLRDAEVRGYPEDPDLMNELTDYKKKVGSSYILEKEFYEPGARELYERRKTEVRASHLMIKPDSTGEEAAKELAETILDSINNGIATFEEMVQRHSDDQFSVPNDGDIFYFTAAQIPIVFEDATYATDPGEIYPEVVKTPFGYHIVKVTEKQPRIPKIKASHILISYQNDEGVVDSAAALDTIQMIKQKLDEGATFEDLAKQYSDDTGTKEKGGDLGFFERRMMVLPFDETAFNLEVGEISDIVQTQFGYHIIKLTEKQEYPSFEEEEEKVRDMYKKSRFKDDYAEMIEELKVEFNYSLNQTTVDKVIGNSDSTIVGGEYKNMDVVGDESLFVLNNKETSFREFYDRLRADQKYTGKLLSPEIIKEAATAYSEEMLLEEKALVLDTLNTEFAQLMDDYKNGIFIFRLQEEEIWNKIEIDSVKLHQYYLDNKDDYMWKDRVKYTEVFTRNDSLANHYLELLNNGTDFDSLAAAVTERSQVKEAGGKYDFQEVGSTEFSSVASEMEPGEFSEIIPNSGGHSIIKLDEKLPAQHKTFEEARAEVSGDFQEYESKRLEQEYLKSLEERYDPVIHYDELAKAFKQEAQ